MAFLSIGLKTNCLFKPTAPRAGHVSANTALPIQNDNVTTALYQIGLNYITLHQLL